VTSKMVSQVILHCVHRWGYVFLLLRHRSVVTGSGIVAQDVPPRLAGTDMNAVVLVLAATLAAAFLVTTSQDRFATRTGYCHIETP
jgi:hypothetical protein